MRSSLSSGRQSIREEFCKLSEFLSEIFFRISFQQTKSTKSAVVRSKWRSEPLWSYPIGMCNPHGKKPRSLLQDATLDRLTMLFRQRLVRQITRICLTSRSWSWRLIHWRSIMCQATMDSFWKSSEKSFVFRCHSQWLLSLYSHCLRKSPFPKSYKRTVTIHFPKEGRNKSDPASYRPICLFPAVGKILDKLYTTRLMNYLKSNSILNVRVYGFKRNQSTINVLMR